MASRMGSCIVLVVMAMFIAGATAQPGDCAMAYQSLTPCFAYVSGPQPTPGEVCCDGIRNVNTMSPQCLCQVVAQMNSSSSVNATKAYALPRDCGVDVDTSQCPAFATPPMPTSMPPMPTSMPPGLSAPPLPAAPPMDISIPPGMAFPPGLSAPPKPAGLPPMPAGLPPRPAGLPPLPAGLPPVSAPPMFTPPAIITPTSSPAVSGPGSAPGLAPADGGAASVSASIAFVAAVAGAVAAFVM